MDGLQEGQQALDAHGDRRFTTFKFDVEWFSHGSELDKSTPE
jgi:hypothetical protein